MTARQSLTVRRVARGALVAMTVVAGLAVVRAQTPAPAPAATGQTPARGAGRGIQAPAYPVLPLGAPFPDFALKGVDNKTHTLKEYAKPKVVAVVFESNHCPVSINYEARVHELYEKYRGQSFGLVAINPNNHGAVRLNELGYTDMSDSLEEMKIRAAFQQLPYPYLFDGETQVLSMKFGAVATPHIFIFDQDRKLRYQGAIDDNARIDQVKTPYAVNAIDAILADRPVAITESRAVGCTTKWMSKATGVEEEMAAIKASPVTVEMVDANALKALRANAETGKTVLFSFWSTTCKICASQFLEIENTYRMYRRRPFDLVTISTDDPTKSAAVLDFLKQQYASGPNKQFASADLNGLQAAWGAKWNPSLGLTVAVGPDGKILFQQEGKFDIYDMRRRVMASIPDSQGYPAIQAYFQAAVAKMDGMKGKQR